MDWQQFLNTLATWATTTGVKLLVALTLLIVSFRIITIASRKLERRLLNNRKQLDKTLTTTLFYLLRLLLKVLVVICLIGYLGIDTSGVTALIASFGVGIGLAVNGALSNLAGGALLLITRPFRIDDYIEAQGQAGTVEDILITATRLRTPDNKVIYLPNGALSSGTIVNYSEKDLRRVDLTFPIAYADDVERAKGIITSVATSHGKALSEPPPFVRVLEHTASRTLIVARIWVKSDDYWDVYFDLLESVKARLSSEGFSTPYDRLTVQIQSDASNA